MKPKLTNVSTNSELHHIKMGCGPYEPCYPMKGCPPNPCSPNVCCPNFGVGMSKENETNEIDIELLTDL